MSQRPETLQLLTEKIEELRETIDIIVLLDSLGFFALKDLLTKLSDTQKQVQQTENQYAGGLMHLLEKIAHPHLARSSLRIKMRKVFTAS